MRLTKKLGMGKTEVSRIERLFVLVRRIFLNYFIHKNAALRQLHKFELNICSMGKCRHCKKCCIVSNRHEDLFLPVCRNLNECENEKYGFNNNKLFLNSHKIFPRLAC